MHFSRSKMNQIEKIKTYLSLVLKSKDFHVVLVEGPAGWGKTTTITNAFNELNIKPAFLGSYSTPLNLFNFLRSNSERFVLIDDCAGLFSNQASMAILKAATWASDNGDRYVQWGSTSQKTTQDGFIFRGKLAIICNYFPSNADGLAVKSRALAHNIDLGPNEASQVLQHISKDNLKFPNQEAAQEVTHFLIRKLDTYSAEEINLRTLKLAYELCLENPAIWKELIIDLLPKSKITGQEDVIRELHSSGLSVTEQLLQFENRTGLKRRRFFYLRKQLGIIKASKKYS
jgi:hypothetical protein